MIPPKSQDRGGSLPEPRLDTGSTGNPGNHRKPTELCIQVGRGGFSGFLVSTGIQLDEFKKSLPVGPRRGPRPQVSSLFLGGRGIEGVQGAGKRGTPLPVFERKFS